MYESIWMRSRLCQGAERSQIINWSQILLNSYQQFLQTELIPRKLDPETEAKELFFAPFVVVSHGTQIDPIFNYANQIALKLWELDWNRFTQMPSRQSAEPVNQQQRQEMLDRAEKQGYIDNYQGIRISSSGKRFSIEKAIIWNLVDLEGKYCGQAATFSQWSFLS